MSGSQEPERARSERRTETEAVSLSEAQDSQQPWRWKPEYWERYWRKNLTVPVDLESAG